jgi:hypothetical protein
LLAPWNKRHPFEFATWRARRAFGGADYRCGAKTYKRKDCEKRNAIATRLN